MNGKSASEALRSAVLIVFAVLIFVLPLPALTWDSFQVGPCGFEAEWDEGDAFVKVTEVEAGAPADGVLQFGDEISQANGANLSSGTYYTNQATQDPRVVLGNAITASEAGNGELVLRVKRGTQTMNVTLQLPLTNLSYSAIWPDSCPKTDAIVNATAAQLVSRLQSEDLGVSGRQGSLAVLFLLSTGQQAHVDAVAAAYQAWAPGANPTRHMTWNNSYLLMALGEYYLRTGDAVVKPVMQKLVDISFKHDANGGWGHWDDIGFGYVRGGQVNAAGGGLFCGIVLARECGVTMDPADFERCLKYWLRYAGIGGAEYGDQWPNAGGSNNGKTGAPGVALSMLPTPIGDAAGIVAIQEAWSVWGFQGGHTGNMTNVLWRSLAAAHVPASRDHYYRNYQDKHRWYLELCRRPDGGFEMLPVKDNSRFANSQEWGMAVALNYTARLGHLRMCGGAPTAHSTILSTPAIVPRDPDFYLTDHAEGYLDSDFESEWQNIQPNMPWHARNTYSGNGSNLPSIAYLEKHMRHLDPVVRAHATNTLGYHGDAALPVVSAAIQSNDARVRASGLRALSGIHGFFMQTSPFNFSDSGRSSMVPLVVGVLQNSTDWWEVALALVAMGEMPKADIVANVSLIESFLSHPSWWVRHPAMRALVEADADAAPAFPAMIDCFVREQATWPRDEMSSFIRSVFNDVEPHLTPTVREAAVEALGDDLVGGIYARNHAYQSSGQWPYELFNAEVLAAFDPDELLLIPDQVNQALANAGHPILSRGKRWNNAYNFCSNLLDQIEAIPVAQRGPLMPGVKALLAGGLEMMDDVDTQELGWLTSQAQSILDAYETAHGEVTPYAAQTVDYSGGGFIEVIPTPYDLRLMLRYDMEEGSGTELLNTGMLGLGANGTLTSATAWAGSGIGADSTDSLNANNGYSESANPDDSLIGNHNLSVTCRVRIDPGQANSNSEFTAMCSAGDKGWNFGVQRKQVGGQWRNVPTFDLRWRARMEALNDSTGRPDIFLEEGRDYFIAFVRKLGADDAAKDNTMLYVYDPAAGTLLSNDGNHSEVQKNYEMSNLHVGIGADNSDVIDPAKQFPGQVDDAQIWNVSLGVDDLFMLGAEGSLENLPAIPTVANLPVSTIGSTTAVLNGVVTPTSGQDPAVTIYYGPSDGGTSTTAWAQSVTLGAQTGEFTQLVSGLADDTTYYFRAFASTTAGSSWAADSSSFTTIFLPDPPTVVDHPATGIASSFATLNGEVTDPGGEDPQVTIYFGDNDGGTTPLFWDQSFAVGAQGGSFEQGVTGLSESTTYYFRCYCVHPGGEDWSDATSSFTTASALAGGTFVSVQDGPYMDPATWEGAFAPSAGDNNTWRLIHKGLGQPNVDTFLGKVLVIGNGGGLNRTNSDLVDDWNVDTLVVEGGGKTLLGSSNRENHFIGDTITLHDGAKITSYGRTPTYAYNRWFCAPNATVYFEPDRATTLLDGPGSGTTDMFGFQGTMQLDRTDFTIDFTIPVEDSSIKLVLADMDVTANQSPGITNYNIRNGRHQAFQSFDVHRVRVLGGDGDGKYEPDLGETLSVRDISIPPGTYNYTDLINLDADLSDVFIEQGDRTGTITVTGIVVPDSFESWAGTYPLLTDQNPLLDFDHDGLPTGIEWVVKGYPTVNDAANVMPGFDNNSDPSDFLFVFRRADEAEADANTTIEVEYGSDLTAWRNTIDHGLSDGVTTTVVDDGFGPGIDRVTVAIPRSLAVGGALYARLRVMIAMP